MRLEQEVPKGFVGRFEVFLRAVKLAFGDPTRDMVAGNSVDIGVSSPGLLALLRLRFEVC